MAKNLSMDFIYLFLLTSPSEVIRAELIEFVMEQFVLFALEKSLIKFEYHRVLVGFLD